MPAIIRLGLLIISWLTICYLPKESVKKYAPVATFSSLLVLVLSILSFKLRTLTLRILTIHIKTKIQ
ncbi:hypothetical protein [Neobacillus bataviensis]|uniref:hypothetical protein n=1 Tax=Neobacillus bataviensis TaxID=220685 RepID=UPI001CBB772C|nr:hypothetical protein [Neobacillus bataviensis]